MVIRLRGFPPPVGRQSACRHRRRGLIVAPQSRLERRDSRCRSAKAPKELKCSALEPPAICYEAGADVPRLTLRDIGPLLFSLIVQGGRSVSSETVSTSSKVPTIRISTKGSNERSSQ